MKLVAVKTMEPVSRDTADVTIRIKSTAGLAEVSEAAIGLKAGKNWEVEFKPTKKKRSLSANAYAWVLMDKLANKLGCSKTEVYREQVRVYGTFQPLTMRKNALSRFQEVWSTNGIGWIVQPLDDGKEFVEVLAYPGTSTYTTAEMARFIDGLVSECREQGIETMEPERLKSLVEAWGK